jgi:hypothetical protein
MRVAVARWIAERKHLSERRTDRVARRQYLEIGHEDIVEFATLVVIELLLPADLGVSQHEQGDGRHLPDGRPLFRLGHHGQERQMMLRAWIHLHIAANLYE